MTIAHTHCPEETGIGNTVMVVLDLRKLISPFSLLKVSNIFSRMGGGETLEVLWDDEESSADLLKILPAEKCESVSVEKLQDEFSGIRIQIKKKNLTQ
jgi:TusA-related sulfurtransferase